MCLLNYKISKELYSIYSRLLVWLYLKIKMVCKVQKFKKIFFFLLFENSFYIFNIIFDFPSLKIYYKSLIFAPTPFS